MFPGNLGRETMRGKGSENMHAIKQKMKTVERNAEKAHALKGTRRLVQSLE
jgi:hypothetical protein